MKISFYVLAFILFFTQCSQKKNDASSTDSLKNKDLTIDTLENAAQVEFIDQKEDTLILETTAILTFEELTDKFQYKELDSLTMRNGYEQLYASPGKYKLYNLRYEDFITLGLNKLYSKIGYKNINKDNYPKLIFAYCTYKINDQIMALVFLNHAEGGYKLDLVTYKDQKAIAITSDPVCFTWGDIGVIININAKRTKYNLFRVEEKEWFQDKLRIHSQTTIEIDSTGNIQEDKVFLKK